jgi:transposase InsO family protein
MTDSPHILQARRIWVRTFLETRDAGLTCRRCGISRPTLRKWVRRFEAAGEAGLRSRSRCPHRLAPTKRTPELLERIGTLRRERNLGAQGIQNELRRLYATRLSSSTIHHALRDIDAKPLHRPKRPRKPKRYSRPVAGDRVQIDSMKVGPGLYQFTAVDDCTRLRVLGLYGDRTSASAAHFFEHRVLRELPFPIARVQTDRGGEFIGQPFMKLLRRLRVKRRPNRPACPHLNGKVERSQQTDLMEFYALEICGKGKNRRVREAEGLPDRLAAWQRFYNKERAHSSLGGRSPRERWEEVQALTPSRAELDALFDPAREPRSIKRGKKRWLTTRK